jgi:hypothetical protein
MLVTGCGSDDSAAQPAPPPTSSNPAAAPFKQAVMLACLRRAGRSVAPVRASDPQLRVLRDVAKQASFQVRFRRHVIVLAFGKSVADAELLEELLMMPQSRYTIVRRGNVVVLYRRGQSAALTSLAGCLRP